MGGHLNALLGRDMVDERFWEELEESLIAADFGAPTAAKVVDDLRAAAQQRNLRTGGQVVRAFKDDVADFLRHPTMVPAARVGKPHVVLVIGVNGSGKTTTIGKLAAQETAAGRKVLVVAADTFRAAAAEQLAQWAQRAGAEIVRHREGSDPAAVVFDGLAAGIARGVDTLYVDTAGRLQSKRHLMEELKKMRRVIEQQVPGAPHETLLVLDAATGQNALSQAALFHEATNVTGLVLTKLDGTAKGGIVVAVMDRVDLPVKYVGFGERIDQLRPFDPTAYADALIDV